MLRGRPRDAAPGRAWTGLAGGLALWAGGLCAVAAAGGGSEAPKFAARGIKGEEVVLEALRGKPVLIEFWAAWCPPCRDSVIPLLRLAGEYGDRLVIVGVSLDTDPKAFEAFAYNHHL